jgi:hypothetical protein
LIECSAIAAAHTSVIDLPLICARPMSPTAKANGRDEPGHDVIEY